MKTTIKLFLVLSLFVLVPFSCDAQCTGGANACSQPVPHVVKFSGVLKNTVGIAHPNTVAIRFVIYSDEMHGTPLWQEVQNVQVDSQGRFEVMLGAASIEGIPDLFSTGEPRWVGVQPVLSGQEEQPRVQLVSVPYALQAGNAQTLGGLPASAFVKATPTVALGSVVPQTTSPSIIAGDSAEADPEIVFRTNRRSPTLSSDVNVVTTPNSIPKFYTNPPLVDSQITDQNGVVSMQNLSNILFADRFTGGVPDAVTACPATGCIIYAVSPNVNLNLGTIDPGLKAITIYLGPYTYTVKQITLRKGLKIIGMGASGGTNGSPTCSVAAPCNGTTLQSINENNPVFVLPQANNAPVTNVLLSGFRILGSVGNTSEDGFFLDASSLVNSGLWYSTFEDIYMEGFAGIAVHLRGRSNGFLSAIQWILFNNVVVYRPKGGANALRLEGSIFELRFTDCQFDGQGIGDGTNIYIGGLPGGGNAYPTSIMFEGLVSQSAATAVQIDGATNITFHNSHHEALWGGYQITNNTNIGTRGLTISDSSFNGNVGSNGGAGYELEITTSLAQGVIFAHNQLFGNPDSIVRGMNFAQVAYQDNLYVSEASNVPPTSGITMQVNPAASINIGGVHSVGLNASTTLITTIQSSLGPGEMVTFFTWYGPVTFGSGGNIDLMGQNTLTVNGSMTFVRNDLLGSLQWIPVSQWSPSPASPSPVASLRK
jgi:hypothetical protein